MTAASKSGAGSVGILQNQDGVMKVKIKHFKVIRPKPLILSI